MPELKFTAGLDASGVDAGAKKIQQAFAGIAKDANKLDSAIENVAGGFDELAAGNAALKLISANIDNAAESAIKMGNAFNGIESAPALAKIEAPLRNLQKELAQTAIDAGRLDSTLGKGGGAKLANAFGIAGKSLSTLREQLTRFRTALDKATDPATVVRLGKAIEATQRRMNTISGAGLGKISSGADTAGQSLQNLSRIAQDAPFGFIGIANNINPLLESFQRLRKESGSTGGALKSLAGSLAGGGGIGLAFGVITAAISFASIGMQAWGGRNTDAKKAVDENAKATLEFAKSLDRVRAEGQATGIQLQGYVNIAKDQSKTLAERNYALEQANKIFGEHGEKLTLVNVATAAVTAQIQKFTQATIQQALATKFADRAADLFINQKDAAKAYGVELAKLQALQAKTQSFTNAQGVEVLTDAGKEAQKQLRIVGQLAAAYKGVTSNIFNVVDELQKAQAAAAGLFGQLNGNKLDPTGLIPKLEAQLKALTAERSLQIDATEIAKFNVEIKKVQDELDRLLGNTKKPAALAKNLTTVSEVITEMRKRIKLLNAEEIGFNTDNAEERYNTFLNAIKTLNLKFKKSLDSDLLKGLFDEAKFAKTGFIIEKGFARLGVAGVKAFKDAMKGLTLTEPIPISFEVLPIEKGINGMDEETAQKLFGIPDKTADRLQKEAFIMGQGISQEFYNGLAAANDEKFNEGFEKVVQRMRENQQAVADIFGQVGESIGKGLSTGKSILSDALSGILNIMGDFLVRIGKTAIIFSKVITGIKAGNALTGLAAGLIAVVAGNILKNIKLPAFATGVRNFTGGTALVGERGPELVNLPRGSSVTPNAQTNSILGQQLVFIPDTVLRGQDIVVSYKRASQSLNRTG